MNPPPVRVVYTKWDGSLHWNFTMYELGSDEHGWWLGAPDGTQVRRGDETPLRSQAFALLIPHTGWWTSVWNAPAPVGSGFSFEIYLDICTPPDRHDRSVSTIDLDLDVARRPDGTALLLDEDEFETHRHAFDYPAKVVAQARSAAAAMLLAVQSRAEPFGSVGPAWVSQAEQLD